MVNVHPADEDSWLNGIIPDLKIDGRSALQLTDRPTKLHGVVTLGEVKGLAKVSETVAHRAGRINPDIKRSAAALDATYQGSAASTELMKYGKGGEYLALVTGSLGNCSADVLVIVDFIAGIKTVRALELRTTNVDQLFSTYRRSLLSSFGLFTTRLWAPNKGTKEVVVAHEPMKQSGKEANTGNKECSGKEGNKKGFWQKK